MTKRLPVRLTDRLNVQVRVPDTRRGKVRVKYLGHDDFPSRTTAIGSASFVVDHHASDQKRPRRDPARSCTQAADIAREVIELSRWG